MKERRGIGWGGGDVRGRVAEAQPRPTPTAMRASSLGCRRHDRSRVCIINSLFLILIYQHPCCDIHALAAHRG